MTTEEDKTPTGSCDVPIKEKTAVETTESKMIPEEASTVSKEASPEISKIPEVDKNSIVVGKALAQLQGIEQVLKSRAAQDAENRKLKLMWLVGNYLAESVERGKSGCCIDGRRVPLEKQIKALKTCAGDDAFLNTVISAIPKTTLVEGEYTREDLKTRFENVYRFGSRVAAMGPNESGTYAYLLSWAKSLLRFRIKSSPEKIDPKAASNQDLLDGAYISMKKDDMQQAVRFLNLTYGPTRSVANEFIQDARRFEEAKLLSRVLLARSAAVLARTTHIKNV